MVQTALQINLSLLDYTPEWLDSGLLTEEILQQQVEEFKKGDDTNAEHYRYRLLHNYLKRREAISDEKLNQILNILHNDKDKTMASSVAVQLLNKDLLSEEQFNKMKAFSLTFGDYMLKYIEKAEKKRLL